MNALRRLTTGMAAGFFVVMLAPLHGCNGSQPESECPAGQIVQLPAMHYDVTERYELGYGPQLRARPAVPDDDKPDNLAIQARVNAAPEGGAVYIPGGTYLIDVADLDPQNSNKCIYEGKGIKLKSGVDVFLAHDTILKSNSTEEEWAWCNYSYIFRIVGQKNVNIYGQCDAKGDTCSSLVGVRYSNYNIAKLMDASQEPGGPFIEYPAGVSIKGSEQVRIWNIEASEFMGDGFYVGHDSKKIEFCGVRAKHNRRTGLAITFANDVKVIHSTFEKNQGDLIMPHHLCLDRAYVPKCDKSNQAISQGAPCLLPAGICKKNEYPEVVADNAEACAKSNGRMTYFAEWVPHDTRGIALESNQPTIDVLNVQISDSSIHGNEVGILLTSGTAFNIVRDNKVYENQLDIGTVCTTSSCCSDPGTECLVVGKPRGRSEICACLNQPVRGGIIINNTSGNQIYGNDVHGNQQYEILINGAETAHAEWNLVDGNRNQAGVVSVLVSCEDDDKNYAYNNKGNNMTANSSCTQPPP